MATRSSDVMVGMLLALVGVGILVAWRSGVLRGLFAVPADYSTSSSAPSVMRDLSGIMNVADRLPSIPPSVSTTPGGSQASGASAGLPDNGYSSLHAPLIDPWAAGGRLDESSRARARAQVAAVTNQPAAAVTMALSDRAYYRRLSNPLGSGSGGLIYQAGDGPERIEISS